jgi:hypothetical protein
VEVLDRAATGEDQLRWVARRRGPALRSRQQSGPNEIALPYDLKVAVKPLTTAGMAAAQAAAGRTVAAIERQARERREAGLALDGLPDLSAEGERDGLYQAQLIRELAALLLPE